MKIDFCSDIHADFWVKELNPESPKMEKQMDHLINDVLMPAGGDVLIIAGDIGHYFSQNKMFLLKMKEKYKHVMITTGNHDLYLVSGKQQEKYRYDSMNRVLEMKRFCKENDIIFFDGNTVSIEGYSFGGTGMSWDKSYIEMLEGKKVTNEYVKEIFNQMNDSRLIFNGKHYTINYGFGAKKFMSTWDPFKYFETEMEKLKSMEPVDVMVSHYPPTVPDTLPDKWKNDEITTFYYFDGEEQIERIQPKHWFYGHTHHYFDFKRFGTHFHCNPLGYPKENSYTVINTLELK